MGAPVSTGGGDASGDFAHLVSASSSTNHSNQKIVPRLVAAIQVSEN